MALTVTSQAEGPGKGATRPLFSANPRAAAVWFGTVDFDASYPTGGEAFNAESESGFSDVFTVQVLPKNGYVFEYVDSATAADRKIIARYADYDAAADGALIQVPDTTNLSAVTGVPVIVWGYR